MIYSGLLFILFSFFIIIKDYKQPHARWLFGLLIGFCISIISLIFYSVYFWDYYYLRNIIFDINKSVWLFLYSLRISSYTVSRLLNIGSALFYYCALYFALIFSGYGFKKKIWYVITTILPIQFILFYDPYIQNEIYSWYNRLYTKFDLAYNFYDILFYFNIITRAWFFLFIFYAIFLLYKLYSSLTNEYIKLKVLGINLGIITIFIQYILIFYWAPQPIIVLRGNLPTYVENYSYNSYISINFYPTLWQYYLYPSIAIFSVLAFLYAFYKYNAFELVNIQYSLPKNQNIIIKHISSSVSHVVKNKMCEIKALIQFSNTDNIATLHKKMDTINTICDDLLYKLDILNSKSSSIEFNFKVVNLQHLFTQNLFVVQNVKQNIDMIIEGSNKPLKCYIDEKHISEVLTNIINNALEAIGKEQGQITITLYTEQGWNIISICDNGPGIPQQNLKRIFHPFFSTKPSNSNWGIGSTYCYKIIEAHKGKITVQSKVGVGTTFYILLPSVAINDKLSQ